MNVDEYFDNLDPPMQDISKELRRIALALLPEVKEELKWNVPTYSLSKNICSIMAHKKHVNLQIFQGAHIEDSQLLEGTGKDMRHLKYVSLDEIKKDVVEKCLKQALKIDN
jgi:hypothetical protein